MVTSRLECSNRYFRASLNLGVQMTDIDRYTGKLISGIPAIRQAVEAILRTSQRERVFRGDFGITFQKPDGTAKEGLTPDLVQKECVAALNEHEPRISVTSIDPIFVGSGLTSISVAYIEKATGKAYTIVVEYKAWPPRK